MTPDLRGKTILVTGANGGLGTPVVEAFLGDGERVAGVAPGIKPPVPPDPNFLAVPASIDSLDSARKIVGEVELNLGPVYALAHLVGGFAGGHSVADSDDATLERMLDLNF